MLLYLEIKDLQNQLNIREYFNAMLIKRIALSSTIMVTFINVLQMIFYPEKKEGRYF